MRVKGLRGRSIKGVEKLRLQIVKRRREITITVFLPQILEKEFKS